MLQHPAAHQGCEGRTWCEHSPEETAGFVWGGGGQ